MKTKLARFSIAVAFVGLWGGNASALVLFSDDFNTDTSGSWTVNTAPSGATIASQQQALFAFDYSTMGIPAAPGSADTLGLRLAANIPGSAAAPVTSRPLQTLSGLSVSPTGKDFGTNYQMTFYAWSNFFGAATSLGLADVAGSEGGTNNVLFAVGTSGTTPLVVGNTSAVTNSTIDGVAFATTGDGGITNDYRAYPASNTIGPTSLLAANSYANTDAFYTGLFPSQTAPAVQQSIATAEYDEGTGFNPQGGMTQAGSFGFAWHKVEITKDGNDVTWKIDDNLIATVDASALTLGGNNIALGQSDVNTSTARHPSLVFTVYDNLVVTDVAPAGTPGDFNNDGKVDAADYIVWRKHLGDSDETALNGNGDNMNGVDQGDYTLWRANFGSPSGSGAGLTSVSVPEPSPVILLLFAACSWLFIAGTRRTRFAVQHSYV